MTIKKEAEIRNPAVEDDWQRNSVRLDLRQEYKACANGESVQALVACLEEIAKEASGAGAPTYGDSEYDELIKWMKLSQNKKRLAKAALEAWEEANK